ncbi:SDR family NAD(P)-dependent oxidoreductase [Leadbettera azotonutricia]|uniref:Chain N, Architecture Of Mammalian Fatty Acid Synthase n=1 Tax=Leadbettera azotonutricia (strain ATCC BAA-888 / DSM 13862 / ZAS-9) TaxID=545695 RepID=F5YDQ8_LEAAZ|nr:SDR family oxidoreductase [Leadbettera azotonutricia]AEF80396.1 chain N, Architecture Of Mammalian Fatty Acid Synthase [Leadbettera azotonutricia ZAS-9]
MAGTQRSFEGRKALVIGGSGGIGRAVALALAKKGCSLFVTGGNSQKRLDDTLKAARDAGGDAQGFLCPADEEGAAERIFGRAGAPDIVVCAWGPFQRGKLEETDEEFWRKMAIGNLVFPGTIVSLAIRGMMQRKYGRILLFGGSNTDTIRGYTTSAAYSAAKTALGVVAKSAARAGAPWGVTCNVICPGLTDTEYLDEEARAYNRARSPAGRAMEVDEVSQLAIALLENPGINGAVVSADQGLVI